MKIKGLLKNQVIILDPHGHYEMMSFDDQRYDFHLHKKTKYEIEGKDWYVDIKIPLNSNRKITITSNKEHLHSIPRKLGKELRDILDDKETRNVFLQNIIKALKDYPKDFQNEENVRLCIKRICIAFGFDWIRCDVEFLFKEANIVDEDKELYKVTLSKDRVKIEDMMKKKQSVSKK